MKNTIKINVCLAENANPDAMGIGSTMSLLDNTPQFKMKRMLDTKAVTGAALASKGIAPYELDSEAAFAMAYDNMPDAEKRMYRIWQMEVSEQADVDAILAQLKEDPNVEFAELEHVQTMYNVPNDPRYDELYGLHLLDCDQAWKISEGSNIVVAVIDSGVDYNHPDLVGNMWQDADGRFGRDFSGDGSVEREDDDPMDTNGHGTHVAGTIAAIGNNGVGIIGVAPKVKIMAVKIFPHATDNVVVRALKYAVDNGARVINNSWGPRNRRQSSLTIEAAVDYVHAKGGICVFAAGNNNDDVQFYSPANRPNTIAVAATDSNDAKASFSNYGVLVDVAAPGVDILSTQKGTINYVNKSGTSMAAPHVSGAVALLLSSNPKLDFNAVYNVLRATSVPVSSAVPIGAGRINCHNMLAASIATPLVRAKTISHDGANGTYLVKALDPITQVPLTGDIHQNGVKVGTVGAPFSVPLVCETKTTRTRVCDMERKPPCVWEVDVVTVCEPSPNSFVLSCPDFKDVSFKLPKFTDHEFEQPS